MRAIDADELIETCQSQLSKIEEWQQESGLDYSVIRKGYGMMIDLLRAAETLNVVSRHEYDRVVNDYEFVISQMKKETKEIVELHHVECEPALMGYEK